METKNTVSPWTIALRFVFTLCLVCTVAYIFKNSLQVAQVSSQHSEQVMNLVNGFLAKLRMGPLSHHVIRKLAHFGEYCLLGFWFMLCLRVYTIHFIKHISWPLFICLGIANVDETLQLFVPGRSSQLTDVWIDFAGVLCGAFVALFILVFIRMCGILWRNRQEE